MASASVRKISIMLAVLHYIDTNGISLGHRLQVQQHHRAVQTPYQHLKMNNEFQQLLRVRQDIAVSELIFYMMHLSDNVATYALGEWVGLDYLNWYLRLVGLMQAKHRYLTPPMEATEDTVFTAKEVQSLLQFVVQEDTEKLYVSAPLLKFGKTVLQQHQSKKLSRYVNQVSYQKGGSLPRGITDAMAVWDPSQERHVYMVVFIDDLPVDSGHVSLKTNLKLLQRKLEVWGYNLVQQVAGRHVPRIPISDRVRGVASG